MKFLRVIKCIFLVLLLTGCGSGSAKPSNPVAELTQVEIASMVAQLYQEIDAAFDESFAAGIDFVIANNYPGAFDSVALMECASAKEPFLDDVTGGFPRVDTLTLQPNWTGQDSGAADWLLAGKSILGDVYEFDLEVDLEVITGQIVVENGTVHLLYGWCDAQLR